MKLFKFIWCMLTGHRLMRVTGTQIEEAPVFSLKDKNGLKLDVEICARCGLFYCDIYDSNKAHLKEVTMIKTRME